MKSLYFILALFLVTAAANGQKTTRFCYPGVTPSPSNTAEPVCTNGNVYTVCGSACPLTCENKNNPPNCIQECVAGCFCPSGMVSYQESCVLPQNCPSNETTTAPNFNAPYVTPPTICPEITSSEPFGSCLIVPECNDQELGSTGGCGEGRMCCSNGCGVVCKDSVSPSPLCPAVKAKAMNESSGLLGAYIPQCEEDGTFSHVQCHEGMCWCVECKTGKAKSEPVGPGVLPECTTAATTMVPSPSPSVCPNGKVYTTCGTMCPLTCANKDSPPQICPDVCKIGCVCPSGMVEHNGGCVAPESCPTNTTNGKPAHCQLPPVSGLCEAYMPSFFYNATSEQCEKFVYGGCGGNKNRFQTKESCLESCACSNGKVYTTCGTMCPLTCENKDNPPQLCPLACKIGCACPSGMVEHNGGCVHPDNCPATTVPAVTPSPTNSPACTNGKVYSTCGTMCPLTCENKDGPPVICPLMCKIGCFCPSGMAEHNGGCVHPDNCPATTAAVSQSPVPTSAPKPVVTVEAVYNAQKLCPVPSGDSVGTCEESCSSDSDCEDWEKCCSNGCGHSCMETVNVPYYTPPLSCPEAVLPICNFHFACASHDECEEESLCCPTGCGALCMKATKPSLICPAVRNHTLSNGLVGSYTPQCEKDGSFSSVQCHASTGKCWCVNTTTGKPLSVPLTAQQPECDSIVNDKCKGIQCDWPYCGEDVQPIMDDDHCCPYCPASCVVGDQSYPSGTSYKSSDGCNTCTCYNGISACTLMACVHSCSVDGKNYYEGQSFNSSDGCNTCTCTLEGVACTERACLPVCKAGGIEMAEGETRRDGCSECTCSNRKIACSVSGECVNPIKKSFNIKMKFNGDFDIVSQDLEGFKLHFKTSLVTKYQSFNLQESQITDINVYRGSVVVQITLEDPDDDEHGTSSNTANVTLVLIHLEQDYNSNNLTIEYQDVTLEPSGEFSYEDSDSDEDEEFFFWFYMGTLVVFVIIIVLLAITVTGMAVLIKRRRRTTRLIRVPTKDEDDVCSGNTKGFMNPTYVKF